MSQNLNEQAEVLFSVHAPLMSRAILENQLLKPRLRNNVKARRILSDDFYERVLSDESEERIKSQDLLITSRHMT